MFLKIGITRPEFLDPEKEARMIAGYLDSGELDIVHLRKIPGLYRDFESLIKAIPTRLHPKLRIHSHFSLVNRFELDGIHLNSRWPDAVPQARTVSRSCHSLQEIEDLEAAIKSGKDTLPYAYVTLSPIFDSISKQGYMSKFDLGTLHLPDTRLKIIALGGVTPDRFAELKDAGFAGAAMLGNLWKEK